MSFMPRRSTACLLAMQQQLARLAAVAQGQRYLLLITLHGKVSSEIRGRHSVTGSTTGHLWWNSSTTNTNTYKIVYWNTVA